MRDIDVARGEDDGAPAPARGIGWSIRSCVYLKLARQSGVHRYSDADGPLMEEDRLELPLLVRDTCVRDLTSRGRVPGEGIYSSNQGILSGAS